MAVDAARAKSLFLAASDLADPAERAAFLDRECGGDAELRARVEALLRANDAAPLPVAPEAMVDSADGQVETEDYGDPTARVGAVLADKYKLVEEIGEGGMGSVFMAQQTEPVKRAVAVKVIKAGMDSREVLARFEAERQALAMMDHPNIAKVLDAGATDGGRPFFVMELVKATSITRYCDEHKLTPRQRLELFVPVCQAIQHAHQKGIIHRDIKPSNVLVAMYDDRPVPKVIDFGLAKAAGQSLTDKTLMTGFGALVGTPEYMSPEQASLNNLDIDTRSDLYSLGVLLYELLTGTTPVDRKSLGKAALLEILRIVREVEALRPSAKLSSIDTLPSVAANRGTEPAKLCRLMKGELDWLVMKALEKDRARRYETANALSRDIQRYLADEVVEARPPSVAYRVSKFVRRHKGQVMAAILVLVALLLGILGTTWGLIRAEERRVQAEQEAQRVKEANNELNKANDKLLVVGARGLLRPLAAQVQRNQPLPPLNDQEVDPLWELAAATDERLRLLFVELALDDPILRQRLKDRAPFAFQAAVGLDSTRRTRVEEVLGKRLKAGDMSPEEQEQLALCLAHLGNLDRRLAGRTADALITAMSKTTDPYALRSLAEGLSAVAARLEPKEAAQVRAQAAATLTQAMSKTTDWNAFQSLAEGLSEVVARLEPKEAAQVRAQAAATLTQAIMSKTTDRNALRLLAQGLSAVAARLEPEAAQVCAQAAATLTQAMSKTTDPAGLQSLAQSLSAVAARLEPKEASQVCAQAAATLTQAMSKTTDPAGLQSLAQSLSAVAARLEPKEASQVCAQAAATLTQAMSKTTNSNALHFLAQGLSAVATRLEPKEASQVCAQAAATLTQAMSKTTYEAGLESLAQGLSEVAARLEPKEAAQAAATLTQAMSRSTDWNALQPLAEGLSAVATRLEPKEASQVRAQAAATLTQAMSKTTDPTALALLAQGLSAVAARLEPKEAAATLTQAMSKTTNSNALHFLAQGLSAVAARLEPKEASQVCAQAAATLTQAMSKTTDPAGLESLAEGLSAVAARLEPKEAAQVRAQAVATLTQAMSKSTDSYALQSLAEGLSAVAARLEPKEAAQVRAQAVATLTQAMSKTTNSNALSVLARSLSAVAARLEPKEAAQVCAQAAATLTQAMSKTTDPTTYFFLAEGLSAVAARLEPKEAAATLTQAMSKTTVPTALRSLEQGLSAVTARLEPKEADQVCAQAAATLTQAMSKTTDRSRAQGLSAVLAREDSTTARRRVLSVTATVAGLAGPGQPFTALPAAQPALGPVPLPLPPQRLVDLLKHPFCVGEARRMVLDQLARHYQRPFADQWDFVDYVPQQKLALDLTTPPARSRMLP